jgi:putative glutamine amidotransferase
MNGCAVGISAAIEQARWGAWDEEVTMAPRHYAHAVQQAGGLALLLPPDDAAEAAPERWLDRIDALILSGGSDIDPAFYGQAPHPATTGIRPERDRFETVLTRAALERGMPVLGICRGMQLMVACAGGRLHQHLPHVVGHSRHQAARGVYGPHAVTTVPGSLLAALIGPQATVPSYHHQGVAEPGSLTVSAYADDGTVEAVERPGAGFFLGVLWHPEAGDDARLFEALVAAAAVPSSLP